MKKEAPLDAWDLLKPELTAARLAKIERVIDNRCRYVRLVVQDVHHPHNVAACLRSAEAFGVQHVHVVTLGQSFTPTSVSKGSRHWLTIHQHQSVEDCVTQLRAAGYRLAAGMPPHSSTAELSDVDLSHPVAVLFGNEHDGVSKIWQPHIDLCFTIPMYGMVESLNISVSAAITLQRLTERARKELGELYFLQNEEKTPILNEWVYRQFKRNDALLERLRTKKEAD